MRRTLKSSDLEKIKWSSATTGGWPELHCDIRGAILMLASLDIEDPPQDLGPVIDAVQEHARGGQLAGNGWTPHGALLLYAKRHLKWASDDECLLNETTVAELGPSNDAKRKRSGKELYGTIRLPKARKLLHEKREQVSELRKTIASEVKKRERLETQLAAEREEHLALKASLTYRNNGKSWRSHLSKRGDVRLAYKFATTSTSKADVSTMSMEHGEVPVAPNTIFSACRRVEATMHLMDLEWVDAEIGPYFVTIQNAEDTEGNSDTLFLSKR